MIDEAKTALKLDKSGFKLAEGVKDIAEYICKVYDERCYYRYDLIGIRDYIYDNIISREDLEKAKHGECLEIDLEDIKEILRRVEI